MKVRRTWVLEDHLCRSCGGRILRCATGQGMSAGGNPLFKCADCGAASCGTGAECLCWCGFYHKHNFSNNPYICLPFSILETRPDLKNGFLTCGCDPKRGEVGILLRDEYYKASEKMDSAPPARI